MTRKPLEARAPIERKPMKRPEPSTKPARAPRKTSAAPEVRAAAIARDRATCQRCGRPGSNLHHREGRGSGGRGKADAERTNGVEWLVVVCGSGNTSGCHKALDEDRERAEREGFVVRRNGPPVDAARVPVKTFQGWRLLTRKGGSVPLPSDTPTT